MSESKKSGEEKEGEGIWSGELLSFLCRIFGIEKGRGRGIALPFFCFTHYLIKIQFFFENIVTRNILLFEENKLARECMEILRKSTTSTINFKEMNDSHLFSLFLSF